MYPSYGYFNYSAFIKKFGKVTTPKQYGQMLSKKKKKKRGKQ